MTKLRILLISLVTLIAIGGIILSINTIFPRSDSSQKSSASTSSTNLNLQEQAQSVANQLQSTIVEDSLKNTPKLNLSSVSDSDLKQFSTKTFSDGSQLLKVDKNYFYNDKFYSLLQKPSLSVDKKYLRQDYAYFVLNKKNKLSFLNYGLEFVDELKIATKLYYIFIEVNVFDSIQINISSQDLGFIRQYNYSGKGLFNKAVKKDDQTITLTLASGNGRNPTVSDVDLNFEKFVSETFSAYNKAQSSSSASTIFKFGN
ncbi:MAG: hypothetical protein WCK98_04035 [bacterium]